MEDQKNGEEMDDRKKISKFVLVKMSYLSPIL